jgi:hypothetical protein
MIPSLDNDAFDRAIAATDVTLKSALADGSRNFRPSGASFGSTRKRDHRSSHQTHILPSTRAPGTHAPCDDLSSAADARVTVAIDILIRIIRCVWRCGARGNPALRELSRRRTPGGARNIASIEWSMTTNACWHWLRSPTRRPERDGPRIWCRACHERV